MFEASKRFYYGAYIYDNYYEKKWSKQCTAVIPYYAYARQERKVGVYKCLAPADIARMLEAMGVDRVLIVDPHIATIPAFFGPKVAADNITTSELGAAYFAHTKLENPLVVSPDAGAEKASKYFTEALKKYPGYENLPDPAVIIKHRLRPNEVAETKLLGDVTGKDCIS